jgi:hypothetical protein
MGFFSGRVTYARYLVSGQAPTHFDQHHLVKLAKHQAGRQRLASADGVEASWIAGDHILDTRWGLAKNIVNDMLWFSMRIDTEKLPSDLLRAYYQVDLEALAAGNPSGMPSARQKRDAKESARTRLEQEGRDGRFLKRKAIEVIWDRLSNEVLLGTPSLTNIDRFMVLFKNTFGVSFQAITAGTRAYQIAEMHQHQRQVDDASPSNFVPGISPKEVAWIVDDASKDFLGNEFLLWLWYFVETQDDTLKLSDGSELTVMFGRTLTLECPSGRTGFETISHDSPITLPEARKAIQSGKMPRKVGLTLVRHDEQYEFTLHAESLAVTSARLPAPEAETEQERLIARTGQIRHLIETLDLLFDAFGKVRFTSEWNKELGNIQRWLKRDEKKAA